MKKEKLNHEKEIGMCVEYPGTYLLKLNQRTWVDLIHGLKKEIVFS